ncbi:MAG: rhomboid family intramembrane serine protease [Bacteroidales bacterium]|nr:rhomboid family intramembrane serine protease [Bacteroidales bacterium]MBQ9701975.1 rhomboid family intramembrane serine protease [Bacteroidales bacterium]MBR1782427.1 rhomboid family intramembrane serine protease [Bacteroidales bacterium]
MASQNGFLQNLPPVTRNLLYVNVIMFIATLINPVFMKGTFSMAFPLSTEFRWWQPVTHMFMHDGFMHIFFNMYSLVMFGMVVERVLGTQKFIWFYLITGFGAVLLHMGVEFWQAQQLVAHNPGVPAQVIYNHMPGVLGASGAVYGVLVAFAMLYPEARLTLIFPPVTLDAKWWVIIFIGIELVTGITGTQMGVAHFAHLGGALFGWLLIRYWRKTGKLYR